MMESILKGFEVWTDAQGIKSKGRVKSIDNISLEGIAALCQLIIELAVRGKLINQNSDDEPATDLLKEVIKNKENLILEGKARKERSDNVDGVTDIPFDAPKGWIWTALQTISTINGGYAFKSSSYSDEGYRVIRISDFDEKGFKDINIVRHKYSDTLEPFLLFEKNILLAMTGGTVGKSYLVEELNEPMLVNQRVASINLIKPIHEEFIHYVIQSKHVKDVIDEAKNSTNDNISMSDIKGFKIPLPPFAEQIRITEKVNELLSWCDELEEQQTANLTTHHNLVKSLLATLTLAANADELQAAWEKLSEHFDTLFCTEDSIEQLRQTILELVVAGRFKTQNDPDTPASETFEKIQEELAQKHGKEYLNKLTRDKSTIEPSDFHFSIPKSWLWCELQDLAILFNGKAHEQFVDENGEYILVNSSFVSSEGKVAKNVSNQLTPLTKGNIAMVMSDVPGGKALVKCYLVEEDDKYSLNQRIGGIDASSYIDIRYLFLVLNRNKYYLQYDDGKKQTNLKKIQILSCPVPLPPIEEQSRIVEKVQELFEFCDTLKSKIERANEINKSLSKTIVEVIA